MKYLFLISIFFHFTLNGQQLPIYLNTYWNNGKIEVCDSIGKVVEIIKTKKCENVIAKNYDRHLIKIKYTYKNLDREGWISSIWLDKLHGDNWRKIEKHIDKKILSNCSCNRYCLENAWRNKLSENGSRHLNDTICACLFKNAIEKNSIDAYNSFIDDRWIEIIKCKEESKKIQRLIDEIKYEERLLTEFNEISNKNNEKEIVEFIIRNPNFSKNNLLINKLVRYEFVLTTSDTLIYMTSLLSNKFILPETASSNGITYSVCFDGTKLPLERVSSRKGSLLVGNKQFFAFGDTVELYWANLQINSKDFIVHGRAEIGSQGLNIKSGSTLIYMK